MQKAIIIRSESDPKGHYGDHEVSELEDLNEYFKTGWKVHSVTPMGAGGDCSNAYAIVIIEK